MTAYTQARVIYSMLNRLAVTTWSGHVMHIIALTASPSRARMHCAQRHYCMARMPHRITRLSYTLSLPLLRPALPYAQL